MALRVLCPKSPHFEDWAQYIEWRTPRGYAAVWLKGSAVQGRHDRQLYAVLEYCRLKKLTPILKRLTHFLKALPYIPRLYTLYFAHYTRKITPKSDFSCSIQKNVLPLHREPAPRVVWHHWRRVADILKRRLLALCSDVMKSRKFQFQ